MSWKISEVINDKRDFGMRKICLFDNSVKREFVEIEVVQVGIVLSKILFKVRATEKYTVYLSDLVEVLNYYVKIVGRINSM